MYFYPVAGLMCTYYVGVDKLLCYDTTIAKYIGIDFFEYKKILKSFGAKLYDTEYYFDEESDCQKCCDYLDETYGPIIKLTEVF